MDGGFLRQLHSRGGPHPGLVFVELSRRDFPLTGYHRPPFYRNNPSLVKAETYYMPLVPFDLPAWNTKAVGTVQQLYKHPPERVLRCSLNAVKEPHPSRTEMLKPGALQRILYQKDNENPSVWQKPSFTKTLAKTQCKNAFISPFNPHCFAFDRTSLCSFMLDRAFGGFTSPSWYMKSPGSFFCLHVEQLSGPFYNLCYEGGTTWWVVQREDRQKLDSYIVQKAKEWFDVPAGLQLSAAEQAAMAGLLYTKRIIFHPADLAGAGIGFRLTEVRQEADMVVAGMGVLVHFGFTAVPDDLPITAARSVNEAVNFLPLQWLETGLPLVAKWFK